MSFCGINGGDWTRLSGCDWDNAHSIFFYLLSSAINTGLYYPQLEDLDWNIISSRVLAFDCISVSDLCDVNIKQYGAIPLIYGKDCLLAFDLYMSQYYCYLYL